MEGRGDAGSKGQGEKPGGKTPRDKNNNKIRQKFQVGDIQLEKLSDSHANKNLPKFTAA